MPDACSLPHMTQTHTSSKEALSGKPRSRFPFAPQGTPFLIGGALATLGAGLMCWHVTAGFLLVLFLFMLNFFRDPERNTPQGDGLFISPADGTVARADPTENGVRVDIFMNVFDVHVNRAPMSGRISHMQYIQGSFVNAAHDTAGDHNERNRFDLQIDAGQAGVGKTDAGQTITFTQIAGLIARRIISYVAVGDHVQAGQRIGMIRFGSRVNCEIPAGFELKVSNGQKVQAGVTVLAKMPEGEATHD